MARNESFFNLENNYNFGVVVLQKKIISVQNVQKGTDPGRQNGTGQKKDRPQ